jgi:hypothetical protein
MDLRILFLTPSFLSFLVAESSVDEGIIIACERKSSQPSRSSRRIYVLPQNETVAKGETRMIG